MDQNVIEHLFEIEREATGLLADAQIEYDKRLEESRAAADKTFKESYEKIINENESLQEKLFQEYKENHAKEFDAFCDEVKSWPQNKSAFNELLEKLLFKA
ncbi:MAG: hypothetical protein MJ159_06095 [Treponemataceae bacterium]|nr:hypothetical protein [Treponemataceae bacterium]